MKNTFAKCVISKYLLLYFILLYMVNLIYLRLPLPQESQTTNVSEVYILHVLNSNGMIIKTHLCLVVLREFLSHHSPKFV